MDKFFTQDTCDRCGESLENGRRMSMFNTDCLCLSCINKERELPEYTKALEADRDQIAHGNYNYEGIGYPEHECSKAMAEAFSYLNPIPPEYLPVEKMFYEDMGETTFGLCPDCGLKVEIPPFGISNCPECGQAIMPCASCIDCTPHCPWDQKKKMRRSDDDDLSDLYDNCGFKKEAENMKNEFKDVFPFNLARDVFTGDDEKAIRIYVPAMFEVVEKLSAKEQDLVRAIYFQKMSRYGIEQTYGIKEADIDNILNAVIKKFQKPGTIKKIQAVSLSTVL